METVQYKSFEDEFCVVFQSNCVVAVLVAVKPLHAGKETHIYGILDIASLRGLIWNKEKRIFVGLKFYEKFS